jgi:hypothetical protein
MVEPYVRDFADPFEGLEWQLEELGGFARTVPPLIATHWQELWDEVMNGPGNPDEDFLDVYARAAGAGTGGGFADFGRTVFVAGVTLGWEAFLDYLALRLARIERPGLVGGRGTARDKLEMELTGMSFFPLVRRYKAASIDLKTVPEWEAVREIQFTRNALVHNHGRYTPEYFEKVKSVRFPDPNDPARFGSSNDPKWLIDREDIPLDYVYVEEALKSLRAFAKAVET